jgi:hypothetical protein
MTTKEKPTEAIGIPVAQRTEAQIRAAFKTEEPSVANEFVRLWAHMRKHNIGLTKIERGFKISSGILSQCFNNRYPGVRAEIAERINAVFYRMEQNAKYAGLSQFMPTQLSRVLFGVYEKTRITRRIDTIQGPEQCGKTRSGKEYAEQNNHGRTRFTEMRASMATLNDFIHGWPTTWALAPRSSCAIRSSGFAIHLVDCDLLIIDEVHLVFKWPVQQICGFFDYVRTDLFANGERGIVLQATDDREIESSWTASTSSVGQAGTTLGSCSGAWAAAPYHIDGTDDIRKKTSRSGRALLQARPRRPAPLTRIAHAERGGRLGRVLEVVSNAWTKAKARNKDLTDEHVVAEIEAVETS